jgi:hypothetical protein
MRKLVASIHRAEEGHAVAGLAGVIGGAGIIVMAIAATNGTDWLTIAGGVVGGIGFVTAQALHHRQVDWELFKRVESIEKQEPGA